MRAYSDSELKDWAQEIVAGQSVRVSDKPTIYRRDAITTLERVLKQRPTEIEIIELVEGSNASGSYEVERATEKRVVLVGGVVFDRATRKVTGYGEKGEFSWDAQLVPDDHDGQTRQYKADLARDVEHASRKIKRGEPLTNEDRTALTKALALPAE